MGKSVAVSVEKQLVAARERMMGGHIEGAIAEALVRLTDLSSALEAAEEAGSSELYRYFPVATIAVLETHFKLIVQAIVDTGSPYLERALDLTRDRLRTVSDVVLTLQRKTVTMGELVAYQLPFNSLASIEEPLGHLLACNLKSMIGLARDALDVRRGKDTEPLVSDVDALWRGLAETFERRHILAHEAASNYSVSFDQAKLAIECASSLTLALDSILWTTIWSDKPLTATEIRDEALDRYKAARLKLARALRIGWRHAKAHGRTTDFFCMHQQWKTYARRWAAWEMTEFETGSIRHLIAATARERLWSARARDVADWAGWFDLEHPLQEP